MAGVPYSFGYSNTSAVQRQPIFSSSVWWVGLDQLPLTPSGPYVQSATAAFGVATGSTSTRFPCIFSAPTATFTGMIPGNFGNGTAYQPTLLGTRNGATDVPIPYNPSLWVADSDLGVLEFTTPPASLGFLPPFILSYWQYTQEGNVFIPGNLSVCGDIQVDGNITVNGPATFNSNVGISGPLYVSGSAIFNSSVGVSGVLRMTVATGGSGVFNSLAATTLPSYFIYNGNDIPAPSLNLPSASSYTGVRLTIKSAGAGVEPAEIFGQLLRFGEYVPSQPSTLLGKGEQIELFSDGAYWIADRT